MRALTAMAQGMWMRLPKGVRTQTRQSPSSSRHALDDDGAVVGDRAGGGFLVGEELEEIFCRVGVEVVFGDEAGEGGGLGQGAEFADQCADAAAEFERAAGAVAFPEGHFAGLAGSGRDEHAVVGDVLNAPGGGAEDEGLVGVGLEDHLLVEFADADGFAFGVGEEDSVEAAIGDGAGVEDGEAGGAVAGGDDVADAVPGKAGAELGEFVGGIAAAEQVEDAFEGGAGEAAEGGGAADEIVEEVDGDFGFRARVGMAIRLPNEAQGCGTGLLSHGQRLGRRSVGGRRWRPVAGRGRRGDCGGSGWTRCGPRAWRG